MGIFGMDAKKKNDLIMLQNIVLNIDEKKLQVSQEFLDKMTKIYISRYMKVINEHVSELGKVSSIAYLFKRYDLALSNLDELIKIEHLYRFNKPIPSEYKKQIESGINEFVNSYIYRTWRKISPAHSVNVNEEAQKKKYRSFFDSFLPYEERLPASSKEILANLREDVLPLDAAVDKITSEEASDFVPMEFENIDPSELNNEKTT